MKSQLDRSDEGVLVSAWTLGSAGNPIFETTAAVGTMTHCRLCGGIL